jgi:hypothetical protein
MGKLDTFSKAINGGSLKRSTRQFQVAPTTWILFQVKSLYADYMNGHVVFLKKIYGKIKVPLKIRIFHVFPFQKRATYER